MCKLTAHPNTGLQATAWEAAVALATTEPYMTLAEGEVERDLVASACPESPAM